MSVFKRGWDKLMGNKSLDEMAFDMKLRSKQLERDSKKLEKEEKAEKTKIKKAIEKGNKEGAQIYAQNAIRKKNAAQNMLKLSARFDAVSSRLKDAAKNSELQKDISKCVPQLQRVMDSVPIEKLAEGMEQFEQVFEDLDVRSEFMAGAIDSTTAQATPANEVDSLIKLVGEEHALDVKDMLMDTPIGQLAPPQPVQKNEVDPLEARLANLRSG